MSTDTTLHTKYRPASFEEMVGNKATIKSIATNIKSESRAHAYMFVGNAGVGKTTLARILAREFGCDSSQIIEVDAANEGSVDSIRKLVENSQYRPMVGDSRVIIVDECHALSQSAWSALLKSVEEPLSHMYWIFCTSEVSKLTEKAAKAAATRCMQYTLKDVDYIEISEYLAMISEFEGFKMFDGALDEIGKAAKGSLRQGLVNLSKCRSAENMEELKDLLSKAEAEAEGKIIDLARLLAKGEPSLMQYKPVIDGIVESCDPSKIGGFKPTLLSFVGNVMKSDKTDKQLESHIKTLYAIKQMSDYPTPKELAGELWLVVGNAI